MDQSCQRFTRSGANLQVNSTRLLDNQTRPTHCQYPGPSSHTYDGQHFQRHGPRLYQKPLVALRLLARWLLLGTGVICSNLAEGGAWIRSHDDPEMVDRVKDLTSGLMRLISRLSTIPGWYKDMGKTKPVDFTVDRWTILQIPIRPSSVGTITLTDSSPSAHLLFTRTTSVPT